MLVVISLQSRAYTPAPRLRENEDDDFLSDSTPSTGPTASTAGSSQSETFELESNSPSADAPKVNLIPFETLKGRLNYHTLKALIFKPFTLSAMSEVQRRVLQKMPYLAGGLMEDTVKQTLEEGGKDGLPLDGVEELKEDPALQAQGRQDLLVKAKTGTGKTIVSTVHIPHDVMPY
jgi:ATP-dependent RNA helicase MSS116